MVIVVYIFPCSTVQGVSEGVRSVVREEVETALQRHAHTVNPEAQAQEERARKQVSHSSPPDLWTNKTTFHDTLYTVHNPSVNQCT